MPTRTAGTPVYRFANLSNGGYFYTGSAAERDATIANYPNMRFEGSTFSVAEPGTGGALPVYRLANLNNGAYLYTTSPQERAAAVGLGFWRDEGISFHAPGTALAKSSDDFAGFQRQHRTAGDQADRPAGRSSLPATPTGSPPR
jgi:hypothetical protein